MKNIDKIRAMSAEELVLRYQSVRPCEVCSYFEGDECSLKGYAGKRECNGGRIKWLTQGDNLMPELKAGDLLFTGKIVEFYVAITPDKLVKANCFVVMDLDNVLKHDKIAYVARWNSDVNDIERIWRADDDL